MAKIAQKDPAAVALGRKGGKKGGPARAARLTPEQRSESARKAVQARWAKTRPMEIKAPNQSRVRIGRTADAVAAQNTSDQALLNLLERIKATDDPATIKELSAQLERIVFHKQFS